jgi:tRNA threonylcarbamoyladenosine biosynthesis protein TsaB
MRVLALDTATRTTAVALAGSELGVLEARDDPPPGVRPRHATRLLPLAAGLLERAGIGFPELDRLAVGVGPGTFTGLRIGIATASALARAARVPIVGVSTLHSLALNAREDPVLERVQAVAAVLDARRGEVFAAVWRASEIGPSSAPILGPQALAPDALAEMLAELDGAPLVLGEGAIEFRSVLERSGAIVPDEVSKLHGVTAAGHCRIAPHLQPSDPEGIHPEYLRLPDAELARRAAAK